ncbi:MAG: DUF4834 family protein [Bacteroidaceae bacterium]|nr:DUF4834 family protein [Bacteroidaceae bacterium]
MFSFIFLILFLAVLFIFIIGGSIIRGILNLLFGRRTLFGQYSTQRPHSQSQAHQQQSNTTNKTQQTSSKKRNKIFDASEGEYVDFEEIHD